MSYKVSVQGQGKAQSIIVLDLEELILLHLILQIALKVIKNRLHNERSFIIYSNLTSSMSL